MTEPAKPMPAGNRNVTDPAMIEIFRAGTYVDTAGTKRTFTEADLADIAKRYDPKVSEAPMVVGHPTINAPAYGWFDRLVAKGASLLAVPRQVDPAFAGLHNEGKFKKRSASFFALDSANNPTPGKYYLRHVGFLGAAPPAVKGLQDYTFADKGEGVVEFSDDRVRWGFGALADLMRRLRDRMIETDGLDKADSIIPDFQIEYLRQASEPDEPASDPLSGFGYADPAITTEENPMTDKSAELAARETQLAAREQKIADAEKATRRSEVISYADGLVAAGKLLPRQKAGVVELLLVLPVETPISFADGDKTIEKPAGAFLREVFESLPAQIDFAEKSRDTGDNADAINFAAPAGTSIDPGKVALWNKAKAHQASHPNMTLANAYIAVGGT